jgi:N-acetyl-anhydromuramoyl-L-alanine amidase
MTKPMFADGWWSAAERRPSPNHDERPPGTAIDMLVVHAISLPPGEFGGSNIHALFCNTLDCASDPRYGELRGLKVSAHFLINRDGWLTQYVSVHRRAWHAGRSRFGGREACNDRSIGIELEGTDAHCFTEAQYDALTQISAALFAEFPDMSLSRVVGHSDIAPTRKTDPGPQFDWIRFRASLAMRLRSA